MPTDSTGQMTRLLMTRYSLSKQGTVVLDRGTEFLAQINPADFKHSYGIGYDKSKSQGAAGIDPKFSAVDDEKVSFSIVLDGTGVVPPVPGQAPDVKGRMAQLHKVVYDYVVFKCEPPRVRLLWGALIFFGRLESLAVQYTLFKPSGDPLRAKVDLNFIGAMSKEEERLVSNRASSSAPVRTETVRESETLPQMCLRVYGDASIYTEVARYNGITSFRQLKPGAKVVFPPLG